MLRLCTMMHFLPHCGLGNSRFEYDFTTYIKEQAPVPNGDSNTVGDDEAFLSTF